MVRDGETGEALYMILDGEVALIDRKPHAETVSAKSDTVLLALKAEDFRKIMEDYPALPINICKILVQRVRALQERLKSFG